MGSISLIQIKPDTSSNIQSKKTRQWVKARGRITSTDGPQPHLSALAYMSDSYFIGTVARVHNLWRFSSSESRKSKDKIKNHEMARMEEEENSDADKRKPRASIGMMVSLDHTIYFHRPREIKADDWMLSENESPWSGDGRGFVSQRIWNKEGVLVASCVQEVSPFSYVSCSAMISSGPFTKCLPSLGTCKIGTE